LRIGFSQALSLFQAGFATNPQILVVRMNAPWTALGTPAVSIPMPIASGLPLGLQLTADLNQDARILPAALVLYQRLTAAPRISPA